ncbi:DUF2946 family protein [Trinickia sp. LjRoot230]|uniref:DUF2946 family protein n=1 Tax=Trinickia sp. LjRoot230 TaxID=3342288 RepID=UPI003ECDA750
MDDIVKAALTKWPNVPHCTGWLLLDRRGQWRMRDEHTQARGELGTLIRHAALIAFINRNYEADEHGQWFFQNGPQRVYVELAYTPWTVRLSQMDRTPGLPALMLVDQTGAPFEPAAVLIDEEGAVLFVAASNPPHPPRVALLHDHDLDLFSDFATLLEDDGRGGRMQWGVDCALPIDMVRRGDVAARFAFVPSPASRLQKAEGSDG